MKRLALYTAVALAVLIALLVLWQFRLILLLFVLSLFVAAAIRPLVERLTSEGASKAVAQLLLFVGGLIVIVLVAALVGDRLLFELNRLVNRLVIEYDVMYRALIDGGAAWQQSLVSRLPPPLSISSPAAAETENLLPMLFDLTQNLATSLGVLVLVLALSIYWSIDQHRFERLWLSLLPVGRRVLARQAWRDSEKIVGAYLRSQIAQSALAAVLLSLGYVLLGLEYPLLLALFGALAAFVPLFGGVLTAVLAFAVGTMQGPLIGLGAALFTGAFFLALELVVEPRLLPRRRSSYMLTVLAIIPLTQAFGLWGLIGAPLLAVTLEVVLRLLFQTQVTWRQKAVQLADLEQRYEQLTHQAQTAAADELPPELDNILSRLHHLLDEARSLNQG